MQQCIPDNSQCPSTIELHVPTVVHDSDMETNAYGHTPMCQKLIDTRWDARGQMQEALSQKPVEFPLRSGQNHEEG